MTVALVRTDATTTHAMGLVDGKPAQAKVAGGRFRLRAGGWISASRPVASWDAKFSVTRFERHAVRGCVRKGDTAAKARGHENP